MGERGLRVGLDLEGDGLSNAALNGLINEKAASTLVTYW
jgi:hypothetical protein